MEIKLGTQYVLNNGKVFTPTEHLPGTNAFNGTIEGEVGLFTYLTADIKSEA